MKTCRKCEALFDSRDCPECKKRYRAIYNERTKEHRLAYAKKWAQENRARKQETQKAWMLANKNKLRGYRKKHASTHKKATKLWRAANEEKVRATYLAWARKNSEHLKKQRAKYRAENTARLRDLNRRWRQGHKEYKRMHEQNRKALKRASGGRLSVDLPQRLYKKQRGMCPVCRTKLGDDYQLDHIIPLARGGPHADDNIQLLHKICNIKKHARDPIEFMQERGFLL